MLSCRTPYSYSRSLKVEGYNRLVVVAENLHMMQLTLVKDNGIVVEALLCEGPHAVVGLHGEVSVRYASARISVETLWRRVVEAQTAMQMFALLCARNEECGVTANLEIDWAHVGVLDMPYDVNLISVETVGHRKIEVIRINLQRLLRFGEGEGNAVGTLSDELEVGVACKAMTAKAISVSLTAVSVLPQAAYYREEDRRMTVPILLITIPKVLFSVLILNGLEFSSVFRDCQHELVVFDLFHNIYVISFPPKD